MKTLSRILCLFMALALLCTLCACGDAPQADAPVPEQQEPAAPEAKAPVTAYLDAAPSGNFNPFTAQGDDLKVVELLASPLGSFTTHTTREQEGYYGYFITYSIDDGVCFSDGRPVTADDIVYSLELVADPMYAVLAPDRAESSVYGTDEYRAGWHPLYAVILSDLQAAQSAAAEEASPNPESGVPTPDLAETAEKNAAYTAEDAEKFNAALERAGMLFVDEIVDYCLERYADEKAVAAVGVDAATVRSDDNYKVAFAMWCWQFASGLNDDGIFCTLGGGEYDLSVKGPTAYDFWQTIFNTYGYNMSDQGIDYEKSGQGIDELLRQVIVRDCPDLCRCIPVEPDTPSYEYVYGVTKEDERTVTVHVSSLAGAPNDVFVVPDQTYGPHEKGDLMQLLAGTEAFGPGPYDLESFTPEETVLVRRDEPGLIRGTADRIVIRPGVSASGE